jgi:hypothetical protein
MELDLEDVVLALGQKELELILLRKQLAAAQQEAEEEPEPAT